MNLLCTKVENIDKELQQIKSQQHDYKNAELSRSEDLKIPELQGDEILYDKIKPIIQVIKIRLTREMIIPEKIERQDEIQKIEITEFYARKRIIGIATILNELTTNYLNGNSVWSYYSREQTMIYSNSREIREADMEEIRQWILNLLKSEQQPTTRAIRKNFISPEIMTKYCRAIGHKYPDHQCSKCYGEDNVIPAVQLE
ncbi:hypothetical protein MTR67_047821 [Solanum verrucosum]|uniref:Uncharacterized protein n=1 Tax=Solanum verrucosum TaxID=315347 RepID=A0AAF0ZWT4_SOLVR|nr:hypothetical protein MTR67_047821 [Solanum verrucosum]